MYKDRMCWFGLLTLRFSDIAVDLGNLGAFFVFFFVFGDWRV